MAEIGIETITPKSCILHPEGYMDRVLGDSLKNRVKEVADRGCKIVVISFAKVQQINSLGMSGLLESFEIMDNTGGEIWFANLSQEITPILEAAGVLDLVLDKVSLEEARQRLPSEG